MAVWNENPAITNQLQKGIRTKIHRVPYCDLWR